MGKSDKMRQAAKETEEGLRTRRGQYEKLSQQLGGLSARLKITPNAWTLISVGFSVLSGIAFAQDAIIWGFVWMGCMVFGDVMDGATARAMDMATRFGGVLDHVSDRYAEFFIFAGIGLSGRVASIWVLFALFGMVMASYVRAKAESKGRLSDCNVGIAGRLEKLLILSAGLLVEYLNIGTGALTWAMILIGLMSHYTALQRIRYTYAKLGKQPE